MPTDPPEQGRHGTGVERQQALSYLQSSEPSPGARSHKTPQARSRKTLQCLSSLTTKTQKSQEVQHPKPISHLILF